MNSIYRLMNISKNIWGIQLLQMFYTETINNTVDIIT